MQYEANGDGAVRKLRLAVANSESARREGVSLLARGLIQALARNSPRDTNRYVRGWLLAGRMIGVALPLPPLRESRYHRAYIERFELYVETLESRLRTLSIEREKKYPNGPPKKGVRGYERFTNRVRAATEKYLRAKDDLATLRADPYAIVIGGGRVFKDPKTGAYVQAGSKKTRPSLRTKVYGGFGVLRHTEGKSIMHLRDLEAHSAIVEARKGVVRRSMTMLGLRALGKPQYMGLRLALRLASQGRPRKA